MTSRFLLLLGGSFTSFFMTIALAIPPLTVKNRGVRLFRTVRLIGQYGTSKILNLEYMHTWNNEPFLKPIEQTFHMKRDRNNCTIIIRQLLRAHL